MNGLHKAPYSGQNNKKKTKGRIAAENHIQSIPIFQKVNGRNVAVLGFKYINHKESYNRK